MVKHIDIHEWVRRRREDGASLEQICADAGISMATLFRAMAGVGISYGTAKQLADSSGGKLDVIALCEGRSRE